MCSGIYRAAGGQTFSLQVTQSDGVTMMAGSLTSLKRETDEFESRTYSKAELREGITIDLEAGHSYHLEILKAPAANGIDINVVDPDGEADPTNCVGRVIGPWIIRVA